MPETIYARFTDVRASRFRVMTRILKGAEHLYVEKRSAPHADAEGHLKHTARMNDVLQRLYEGRVAVCPCEYADGVLTFPFVEGASYQSELNEAVLHGGPGEREKALGNWISILEGSLGNIVPFRSTKPFETVFAGCYVPDGVAALAVANLDVTGDNLIRSEDGKLTLIDYEWVMNFPVPRDFAVYRNLRIMYERHWKHEVRFSRLLDICGVEMDPALLEDMNLAFTRFICVESDGTASPSNLLALRRRPIVESPEPLKYRPHFVFFDTGNGFGELEKVDVGARNGSIDVVLDVEGAQAIRFDPFGGERTLVTELHFVVDDAEELPYEPAVSSPGPDGALLLPVPANIRVSLPEGARKLHVTGIMAYVPDPRLLSRSTELLRVMDDERLTIQDQRNQIAVQKQTVEERNAELERINQQLAGRNAELYERHSVLEKEKADLQRMHDETLRENAVLEAKNAEVENRAGYLENRAAELEAQCHSLADRNEALLNSKSWKSTRWLRRLHDALRRK